VCPQPRRVHGVRIESPGKDFEVERALIAAGADAANDDERFDRVSRRAVQDLSNVFPEVCMRALIYCSRSTIESML